jgi:drug/metabolite transporter (DMT)-like permease
VIVMTGRLAIAAGFAVIYAIWSSTYLATALAVETLPPFLMMGARSLTGGAILYGAARLIGAPAPTRAHWWSALIVGALYFVGCHGLMAHAQQSVPSGIAALLMATLPLWVPLIGWLRGKRPAARTIAALMVGFAGVALLIAASRGLGSGGLAPLPVLALLVGAASWALGSVLSRTRALPESPTLGAGMALLLGGAMLVALGIGGGEVASVDVDTVSLRSLLGLAWLTLGGSVVAFAIYNWLLRATSPERAATYAYVSPVGAVVLGALVRDEVVTAPMLAASALILAAVVVALTDRPIGIVAWVSKPLARRTS